MKSPVKVRGDADQVETVGPRQGEQAEDEEQQFSQSWTYDQAVPSALGFTA